MNNLYSIVVRGNGFNFGVPMTMHFSKEVDMNRAIMIHKITGHIVSRLYKSPYNNQEAVIEELMRIGK